MWRRFKSLWRLWGTLLPSRVRIFLMRRRGAVIGQGVWLGRRSVFQCGKIVIGDGCQIAARTQFTIRGLFELGEGVQIANDTRIHAAEVRLGAETSICDHVVIGGDRRCSVLTTGPRCYVGDHCIIDLFNPVTLGEEVGIGGHSRIYTHGSWQSQLDGFPIAFGSVSAGDFSWIGAGATIFAGVEIGEFATVGGGTVMRRRVPSYSLAMGNPGKVVLQNGSHLVHMPEGERFELCRQMVEEVAEHQRWMGTELKMENDENSCRVSSGTGVLLFRRQIEKLEKVTAVISFQRMSEALILEFEAAGVDWFDMDRRRCSRQMTEMNSIVRGIFSARGVRFQTTGRGEITGAADKKRGSKS